MTTACRVCHEPLDQDCLRTGPLREICLECLSPSERQALELDLNHAASVQAHLLPQRSLTFGGWQIHYHYEPLGMVSGDHIDLIRPDRTGDALHFLFGDVSGKGVAASILMANLQALFRSLVSQEESLAAIVTRANEIFSMSTAARSFATLVAGRLRVDGTLELVNAGHDGPYLVAAREIHRLEAAAVPLGFRGGTGYEARALRLEPDDFLFLYTDGVTEARNVSEEEFGALRVCSGLAALRSRPAGDVVHSVLDAVQAFRGGAPQMDDVSAMAIRWRG